METRRIERANDANRLLQIQAEHRMAKRKIAEARANAIEGGLDTTCGWAVQVRGGRMSPARPHYAKATKGATATPRRFRTTAELDRLIAQDRRKARQHGVKARQSVWSW